MTSYQAPYSQSFIYSAGMFTGWCVIERAYYFFIMKSVKIFNMAKYDKKIRPFKYTHIYENLFKKSLQKVKTLPKLVSNMGVMYFKQK